MGVAKLSAVLSGLLSCCWEGGGHIKLKGSPTRPFTRVYSDSTR